MNLFHFMNSFSSIIFFDDLFGSNKIETDWMNKVFGLMNVMLWNVNVYLRFAISLNRLIAITLPLQTSTILNVKNTSIVVLLCWLFGFCHITPYLRTEKCFILFNTTTWSWTFSDSSCIRNGWNSANFYTILAVLIAILLLDFTTIISLKSKNNGMKCQDREQFYSYVAQRRRLRMEIRLFVQTIYENSIFFYAIVNFYYFSTLFKNRWIVFFTSTFVWQICLALDGLIISLFHFRPSHLGIKSIRTKTPMMIPAITKSFNFKAKKHEKNACVWTWK
ncbi:hypothetical protein DICVIV_11167 [Dictyocaulus viviparus]|uniref:G-protein coupled receptors family 1 profile domain-containing protein n=1 Tax=Dictyocaulus viviparus TaxID=29172 RepID=A0A0D8XKH1_DICVI|nr:hypothetical protein DICVIV_11167 [Dictyocaulus viviparus]